VGHGLELGLAGAGRTVVNDAWMKSGRARAREGWGGLLDK
jgi:hypothetical protein